MNTLKQIDNRYKYAVFGYLRLMEKELSLHSLPTIILYLCLSSYYGEYFSKSGHAIEISKDGRTAIKIEPVVGWKNVCYGNLWIDSLSDKIATWTLKFDCRYGSRFAPLAYIYIVSNDKYVELDEMLFPLNSTHLPNYGFNAYALECALRCDTLQPFAHCVNKEITHQHGGKMETGETFQVILNLKNETIGYKKINQAERVLFERIAIGRDLHYKLAISVYHQGCSASIRDFKIE